MGTNRAALVKFRAATFLEHFEFCSGLASLPHDWQQIMRDQDARTRHGALGSKIYFMSKVAETPGDKLPDRQPVPVKYPKPKKPLAQRQSRAQSSR